MGRCPCSSTWESRDVDEVGYTLRTASLMTGPEYFSDDRDRSDYHLFGVRYLILPARAQPPVQAELTMRSGPYWLWTLDGTGYVQAGRIVGDIPENRADVGAQSFRLLSSGLAGDGAYGLRRGWAVPVLRCSVPPMTRGGRQPLTADRDRQPGCCYRRPFGNRVLAVRDGWPPSTGRRGRGYLRER